jgi:hypothetical protein
VGWAWHPGIEKKTDRVVSARLAMVKVSNPDDEAFIIHFTGKPTWYRISQAIRPF